MYFFRILAMKKTRQQLHVDPGKGLSLPSKCLQFNIFVKG